MSQHHTAKTACGRLTSITRIPTFASCVLQWKMILSYNVHYFTLLNLYLCFYFNCLLGALEKRNANTIHVFTFQNMRQVSSNNNDMKKLFTNYFQSIALNLKLNDSTTAYLPSLQSDVTATWPVWRNCIDPNSQPCHLL